jgi:DNA polymerase-3 subunit gamma/tau
MADNDYLHLAAKYRPTAFSEVVGQSAAVGSIVGMIRRRRVPPAIILHGPYSTGKTTLARLIAYYINCQNPDKDTGEPCKKCNSCTQMLPVLYGRSVHPDVREMNVALHGGIDNIRQLQSLASQAPRYNYLVFILDEAHQITGAAFQGALKMLEDPPKRTRYILCTTNLEKVPDTIRSRCHIFGLSPLSTDLVAKRVYSIAVAEKFRPPSKDVLKKLSLEIAAASDGHLRDALGLLDNVINFSRANKDKYDWDALVTKISTEMPELAPYKIVHAYVEAMMAGEYSYALQAVQQVSNEEYFVRRVIESFQLLFYQWIDKDALYDKGKFWMVKGVKAPCGDPLFEDMAYVLDTYASALERIKSYGTEPRAVIEAATLRVLGKITEWETK